MSDRTIGFEYDNDFWFLKLHNRPYTDEELAQEASKAITNLVRTIRHKDGISEEQVQAEAKAIPWQIVESATLPKDRYFRKALRAKDGKFVTDMAVAREVHMDNIRKARNKALVALDTETMKAVGKGDNAARDVVEAQKQVLRDIPQTLDLSSAQTPEELRAIWPSELA